MLRGLESGEVDVVVGTHRMLSADVRFKRLGLLVIDEEQRFGVRHKEAIKSMRADVDVLTLTATPVPRTLEMSLTGIRDMSLLDTPPADRQPILTYVGEHADRPVAEAIRRELLREGQIFYVHNRVADIEHAAERVRSLVPEARVAVAHGRMDEGTLERVVLDFADYRYDVLVCTTIIESGIDSPRSTPWLWTEPTGWDWDSCTRSGVGSAGPGEGRTPTCSIRWTACSARTPTSGSRPSARPPSWGPATGSPCATWRSGAQATCWARPSQGTSPRSDTTSTAAWSARRSPSCGGEAVPEPTEVSIEVPVDAHIPAGYISREAARLEAYRRLASVTGQDEVDDIRSEWIDRFGPVPEAAESLLSIGRLRVECLRAGVSEVVVTRRGGALSAERLAARLAPVELPASRRVRLRRLYGRAGRGEGGLPGAARSAASRRRPDHRPDRGAAGRRRRTRHGPAGR